MKVLLDTHTFLWAVRNSAELSRTVASIITDPSTETYVSAVTAWEVATKVRTGKLAGAEDIDREFLEILGEAGYRTVIVTVEHTLRAGRMPGAHRDPFDRMLSAQALAMDIPILSIDAALDQFGVRRIW